MSLDWLEGLAFELHVTFMEIDKARKPRRAYRFFKGQTGERGLASAKAWLQKGSGVAILLDPKYRLWVLDADNQEAMNRVFGILQENGITPLVVRTRQGAHFYFLLPETYPLRDLKCHWPAKDEFGKKMFLDFKFGPNSWVVAPGTIRGDGGTYITEAPWRTPPVADPGVFCSHGDFHRHTEERMVSEPMNWPNQNARVVRAPHFGVPKPSSFLVSTRKSLDRKIQAKAYLHSRKVPIAISGEHGRATLAGVCSHLVVYLGQDLKTAYELLTYGEDSWNRRCRDSHGNPYSWSEE